MNNENQNEKPELKTITQSGTYTLKMCKPKDDVFWKRFAYDKTGTAYARIFFLDDQGNCLTQFFSAKSKALAIVLGKFSGQYVKQPDPKITVEDLAQLFEPCFAKKAKVEVEVKPGKEYNGKPQWNYDFKKIEPASNGPGAIPF